MCLGLTVPAFAAESSWKLEVVGKTDAEVFVGEKTFTVRDWDFSRESHYDAEYDYEEYTYIATKTDSRQYTAENLYILSKGDMAVFTKGGESFNYLYMTVWSDPDGDGVYDSRLPDLTGDYGYGFLPADVASPQSSEYPYTASITFGLVNWAVYGHTDSDKGRQDEYGSWDLGDWNGFPALTVTELKMRPDMLLELYGPNTLVSVTAYDEGGKKYDVCTILVEGNISQPTVPTVGNFTDVKTSDFFAEPVQWAVEKGITVGNGDGSFGVGNDCKQEHILTFLWRAQNEPEPTIDNPYSALNTSDYYAKAAIWAYEKGLITDKGFDFGGVCTRAMVVTYLWKLAGSPKTGTSDFTDVPANADYAQAVAWAVEQGVTSGIGNGQFDPDGVCTRGQIVTFLYRAFAK